MRTEEEILLGKQVEYFDWLRLKSTTPSIYAAIIEAMDEYAKEVVQHFSYWCVDNGWVKCPKLDRWKNNIPTHITCTTEELFNKFGQNKTQI